MNKKIWLAAVSTIAISAAWSFSPLRILANSVKEDYTIKHVDGWRAVEMDDYKINSATDSILIEGLNPDPGRFTAISKFMDYKPDMKRLTLSAEIKTANLEGWAGLWMRIDGSDKKKRGFDNMQDRKITDTHDWKSYQVVLDVPTDSQKIVYGALVSGKGKVWIKNISLRPAHADEQSTGTSSNSESKEQPQNLELK